MTLYTFYLCDADGFSASFDTRDLPYDSATFSIAGDLLKDHVTAEHVAVWNDDRAVLSRHREPPVIRAIDEGSGRPVTRAGPARDRHPAWPQTGAGLR